MLRSGSVTPRVPLGNVRRRDFLAWMSALLVTPSMEGLCRAATVLDAVGADAVGGAFPLAIGYLEDSDGWDPAGPISSMAGGRVVPARELPGGDVDLAAGSARLTVHGFYPELPPAGVFDWMEMSVFFPSPDPARAEDWLRYRSWAYGESPVLNLGSANRFDVPVGADGSLPLTLDTGFLDSAGDEPVTLSYGADFTVDGDPLRPKLRRGAYLLALVGDPWAGGAELPAQGDAPGPELLSLVLTVEEAPPPGGGGEGDEGDGEGPPPEDEPPAGGCGASGDRILAGEVVGSSREETACASIAAYDYQVLESGDVTFEAPEIALGEGFEVGGRFRAGS